MRGSLHRHAGLGLMALVGSAGSLPAQDAPIRRGSVPIGGTAHYSHFKDVANESTASILELTPRVGYFVARGLVVSGNLRFQHWWADRQSSTGWGIGPGLTYYIHTGARRLYPFLSVRTMFTWDLGRADFEETHRTRATGRSWLASGGALLMVGHGVGITGELFYQRDRFSGSADEMPTNVNHAITYGLQWGIAAFIY